MAFRVVDRAICDAWPREEGDEWGSSQYFGGECAGVGWEVADGATGSVRYRVWESAGKGGKPKISN